MQQATSTLRVVDSRIVDYGTDTAVTLYVGNALGYSVEVEGKGIHFDVYVGNDAAVALDAFRHPFARDTTPNIWNGDEATEITESQYVYDGNGDSNHLAQ